MPTIDELERNIECVRREIRNLVIDPNQPPDQAALIKILERSARAELALRVKALNYEQGRQRNERARLQVKSSLRQFLRVWK